MKTDLARSFHRPPTTAVIGALVLALLLLLGPRPAAAETLILESTALKLEVTTAPYGYRVLQKSSGEVLVAHSATTFTASETPVPDAGLPDAGLPDAGVPDAGAPGDAAAADAPMDLVAAADAGAGDGPQDGNNDGSAAPPPARSLRALAATRTGSTPNTLEIDLTLEGTADPAHARFTFASPEVLEVELSFARQATRRVKEEFEDRGENVYGIWEYPWEGNLDNRGVDEDYLGLPSLTGSLYTSARAPFYVTSRGYGVYARSSARGHFTVAVAGKTSFWFDEPRLRYAIIQGAGYYDVLERYTALAGGGPFMPPLWSMGTTWWHDDFNRDLRASPNAQASVVDLATQLQARRIPAAALMIDRPYGTGNQGWGNMDFAASGFPDPRQMVMDLHTRGLELVLWIANRAWNDLYTDGRAQGFLFPGSTNLGPAADLRNPAAYDWMKGKLAPLPALGAKGYKIDRGEQGEHPDSVQNENVTLFGRLARESLQARHGEEAFVFARNVHDGGRKNTAVWNGDSEANFTGLAYSIAAGLRSGMIVMPLWGSDTGGYLRSSAAPTEEVFARWFGFSAFSPSMEVLVGDGHTPWYHYSPALVEIARKMSALHHDLIPYTRSFIHAATRNGRPVMRALVFEYPTEPNLTNLWDQYLYGSELLVAPVVTAGAVGRAVYLPPGRWLDYHGRRQVAQGPQTVATPAPLDTVPVFVREGAIVPRGDILKGNNNWTADWAPSLRVEIFPAATSLSRRFDYFNGQAVVPITATSEPGTGPATATTTTTTTTAATARVTVALGDLGLPTKLEIHLAALGRISRDGTLLTAGRDYSFDPDRRQLNLHLGRAGATTVVIEDAISLFAEASGPGGPAMDAGVGGTPGQGGGGGGCAVTGGVAAGTPAATTSLALVATALSGMGLVATRRRWRRRWRQAARSASSDRP
jgi:alpha-D-xyloside xylohydrolase